MANQHVLVDTSVWIKYFQHGNSSEAIQLDRLIIDDSLVLCEPIKAEILSGVRTIEDYKKLKGWLEGFTNLPLSNDIWIRAGHARFNLAKKGIQQSLVDLIIAWTAHDHGVSIWTLDADFNRIKDVVGFKMYHY